MGKELLRKKKGKEKEKVKKTETGPHDVLLVGVIDNCLGKHLILLTGVPGWLTWLSV